MKSQVRIIGGKWRGSKLPVIDAGGLRPTPDRIRETLFNWLAMDCPGASVLDCFAGSGALGLEAASRGARSVLLLEQQADAITSLRSQAQRFDSEVIEVAGGDALASIGRVQRQFDIVFIDPPYAQPQLRAEVLLRLEAQACLRPGARIYFEWPPTEQFELPSPEMRWLKRKTAAQVNYAIAEWRLSG